MKVLKIIVIFLTAIILIGLIGLVSLNLIFEDRILSMSLEHLNKHMNVKIKVQGMNVSMLKNFPRASVNLRGVEIEKGSLNWAPEFEPGLLSLSSVSIQINLWRALKYNVYDIDRIVLKNGWINLYFDHKGNSNFDIFTDTSASSTGNWLMNLNLVALDDVTVNYIHLRTGWIFKGLVERGRLRGSLTATDHDFALRSNIRVYTFRQGGFYYLRNQNVSLSGGITVSPSIIGFNGVSARVGSSNLSMNGELGRNINDEIKFNFSGSDVDPNFLLSFLSQNQLILPRNTRTRGAIGFNLTLSGRQKMDLPYSVNLTFSTNKLSVYIPDSERFEVYNLRGNFNNGALGKLESSEISIPYFELSCKSSSINGSLRIKDLVKPLYHLKIKHKVNLLDLYSLGLELPFGAGNVWGEMEILGKLDRIDSLTISSIDNAKIFSILNFNNISLGHNGGTILNDVSGSFLLNNREIEALNASGLLFNTRFTAIGQVNNATGYLLNKSRASVEASLTLDSLNTSWLGLLTKSDLPTEPDSKPELWDMLSYISGTASIKAFNHKNFSASPLSCKFFLSGDRMSFREVSGHSCNGEFGGEIISSKTSDNYFDISSNLSFKNINISTLFGSFNSFGQTTITEHQIAGDLDGSIALNALFANGAVKEESIDAQANITIQRGSLNNVKQLEALSRFIDLEDLMSINFQTLSNTIAIANSRVVIPSMDIQSSALNLNLSGVHRFDGQYEYYFHILLSDVLFRKASRNNRSNNEFGVEMNDGSGRTRLFLKLEGDRESSRVSYDRSSAWQQFRENLRREGRTLNQLFREGRSESDSGTDTLGIPPDNQSTGFEMDWDDNSVDESRTDSSPAKPKKPTSSPPFTIEWDDE